MYPRSRSLALFFLMTGAALLAAACAAPSARVAPQPETTPPPAEATAAPAAGTAAATTSAPASAPAPAEKPRDKPKQAQQRQRKLDKLERDLQVAQLNLAKAQIAIEHGKIRAGENAAQAEKEFEIAKRALQIFTKFTAPNRLARAELGLRSAEDGTQDSQEELDQLLLMYKDEQLADQTKEIVITRARRRLERAREDLELRREELRLLKEIQLPQEERELELAADNKKRAWLQVERDNEAAIIDRDVAVMNAEAEVTRLENELADLVEEIEAAQSAEPPVE